MNGAPSERIRNLQFWLNQHGANLRIDGLPGPATRTAIIETFRNRHAPACSPDQIAVFADQLGCTTRQLRAVASVEAGKAGGWDSEGLLTCLYERHYLWRRLRKAVPFLSDPKPGGYTIDADHDGVNDSWEKLADATIAFGFNFAFECASFGKFQVMGAWWKGLGYPSVAEMIWGLSRDEAAHYELLVRYIRHNGLIPAIRAINQSPANCTAFARGYNGKQQQGYDSRIAAAWAAGG